MTTKVITNAGSSPMYVGSICIAPRETRVLDLADLPAHMRAPAPAPMPEEPQAEPDPLLEMLMLPVNHLRARIEDMPEEGIRTLLAAEIAGRARKGAVEAMESELLRRASAAADDEDEPVDENDSEAGSE